MSTATSLEQRVHFVRTTSGADLYTLRTPLKDLVHIDMAFPMDAFAASRRPTIPDLLTLLLPSATRTKSRRSVLEELERYGAHVAVGASTTRLLVSIMVRPSVCSATLALVLETLTTPRFSPALFGEARGQLTTALTHEWENTRSRAHTALFQEFYKKGHPHFEADIPALKRELADVTSTDVALFHRSTMEHIGAIVCVAGDVSATTFLGELTERMPHTVRPKAERALDVTKTKVPEHRDIVVPLKNKMNVDTLLMVPLTITRAHDDFLPLQVGIAVLGGSATSRLHHELRTKKSLTYGAYASLGGFECGYPGYLLARTLLPNDVFLRGRDELRSVVRAFVEGGVTRGELERRKEELIGSYLVDATSTHVLSKRLLANALMERPVSYLDEYPSRVRALTVRDITRALSLLDMSLSTTAAAGSIDTDGTPI